MVIIFFIFFIVYSIFTVGGVVPESTGRELRGSGRLRSNRVRGEDDRRFQVEDGF